MPLPQKLGIDIPDEDHLRWRSIYGERSINNGRSFLLKMVIETQFDQHLDRQDDRHHGHEWTQHIRR